MTDRPAAAEVRRYCAAIFDAEQIVELRALPYEGGRVERRWAPAGDADRLAEWAIELDEGGLFPCVGVNPRREAGGSTNAAVAEYQTLYADLDGVDEAEASAAIAREGIPRPTLEVATGGGVHLLWRLETPLADAAAYKAAQDALGERLAGDKAARDAGRVLRLPGFANRKESRRRHDGTFPLARIIDVGPRLEAGVLEELTGPPAAEPEPRRFSTLAAIADDGFADPAELGLERSLHPDSVRFLRGECVDGERHAEAIRTIRDMVGRGMAAGEVERLVVAGAAAAGIQETDQALEAYVARAVRSAIDLGVGPRYHAGDAAARRRLDRPLAATKPPTARARTADDGRTAAHDDDDDGDGGELEVEAEVEAEGNGRPEGPDVWRGVRVRDSAVGRRFAEFHVERFAHVPGWYGWMRWAGDRWEPDAGDAAVTIASFEAGRHLVESLREAKAEALAKAGGDEKDPAVGALDGARKKAGKYEDNHGARAMRDAAAAWLTRTIEEFDADRWLIVAGETAIDLRSGRDGGPFATRRVRPDDYVTRVAGVAYDPDATCPRFDAFLAEVLPDDEVRAFVLEFFAWCLTGDVDANQVLAVFVGTGANGKSVLVETIQHVLGEYAWTLGETVLFDGREEHATTLASLAGRRLAVANESDPGKRLRAGRVKALTGDPTITARRMRENEVTFPRTAKLSLVTNSLPRVHDASDGVWRRLRVVPFGVTIPEDRRDGHLAARLRAEGAGILNRLLEAARGLARRGWALDHPQAMRDAADEYRDDENPIAAWIDDRLEVGSPTTHRVAWRDLISDYRAWSEETGRRPLSERVVRDYVGALEGVEKSSDKVRIGEGPRRRGYLGVRLAGTMLDFKVARDADAAVAETIDGDAETIDGVPF